MLSKHFTLVSRGALALVAATALSVALWQQSAPAAVHSVAVPAAAKTLPAGKQSGSAVLAGGCFWGMEEVFQHVKGVTDVVSGYAGGAKNHANYLDSSSGAYNDAESVHITYDPSQISYAQLLQIYFSVAHDPTQVNRQGPDTGSQYRSEIFAANPHQARVAQAYIQQLDKAGMFKAPIATRVSTGKSFFAAEPHHQNYAERHPDSLYIQINDVPKVEALKTRFAQRYRSKPLRLSVNE